MEAAVSLKMVILVYETTWCNNIEERDRQCLNQSVKLSATDCREEGLFIIRIILGLGYRFLCITQFKEVDILPVVWLYILSVMNFVISNPDKFQTNLSLNNRQENRLRRPTSCISCIEKGVMYSAINVCNSLPSHILKLLNNKQQFKYVLKLCFVTYIFYSLEEFFSESVKKHN